MQRVSLTDPKLDYDPDDPEGFRSGQFRPGEKMGAERTGATLYVLPPGQAVCPYHYEVGEEEWILGLTGTATIRHPGGTDELGPMELAFFPPGPDGAHQVRNDSAAEVRVLMWGENAKPMAISVYPDSDKVGVYTTDMRHLFRRKDQVDYYEGEATQR